MFGISQLFIKRDGGKHIKMLMGKFTDDLFMAGTFKYIEEMFKLIGTRFPIIKAIIDGPIKYNSSYVIKSPDITVNLSM